MILYNDKLVNKEDVNISYEDRGYNFGDGVYEVFRTYGGTVFALDEHLQRLERSAEAISLALPCAADEIGGRIERLVAAEKIADGTVYLQITRGRAPRAHAFPEQAEPVLVAYCSELQRPQRLMTEGIKAITLPDIRWLRCDIKSLNLLPNVMAKQKAAECGAGEAILHRDGTVTECSASNVMIVKDGVIHTHPANSFILHGVTRSIVLKLADGLGIPVREEPFTLAMLSQADEVFITSTTMEITPVIAVDHGAIGAGRPGPVTRTLQEAFARLIRR